MNTTITTCTAPLTECIHFTAADHQCPRNALPHHEYCAEHDYIDISEWSWNHDTDNCCAEHCDTDHDKDNHEK